MHVDIIHAPGCRDNDDPDQSDEPRHQRGNFLEALLTSRQRHQRGRAAVHVTGDDSGAENRYRHLGRTREGGRTVIQKSPQKFSENTEN